MFEHKWDLLPKKNKISGGTAPLSSLLILMLSILAIIILYQFLLTVSEEWIIFRIPGEMFANVEYAYDLFDTIVYLVVFTVLFALIRAVPKRRIPVKVTFLFFLPFFVVAYSGMLAGIEI